MEEIQNKKTIACKSCEKPVAKSATKCPHCGETLKTSTFVKIVTGLLVLGVLSAVFGPSSEDRIAALVSANASELAPSGELYETFALASEFTDVQRENLERDITGTTVVWQLPIYEVRKTGEGQYRVQTAGNRIVGTFINLLTRSPEEVTFVEGLREGNQIKIKGTISGTFLRNIEIDPAILSQ